MGKEVAKKESTELAIFDPSVMLQDSGIGFQGLDVKDIAIPYIAILQALSPQVKKGEQKIPGAEEGDIFNNVTSKVVKGSTGISVVPCAYQKRYVEWKDRLKGGGFVKSHTNENILANTSKNDKGQDVMAGNGHIIVTTAHHFVLVLNEDGSYEHLHVQHATEEVAQVERHHDWLAVAQAWWWCLYASTVQSHLSADHDPRGEGCEHLVWLEHRKSEANYQQGRVRIREELQSLREQG
jgi:hypothetical protein